MKNKPTLILLIIGLVLTLILSGCIEEWKIGKVPLTPKGAPTVPVKISLSISHAPLLYETANLTVTLTSYRGDFSNFSAQIILPEGFAHESGDLKWQGDLKENETIQFNAVVKAVKIGDWEIIASPQMGYSDYLYVSIGEERTQVSKEPLINFMREKKLVVVVNESEIPTSGEPLPFIITNLTMSGVPALNQPVELVFTATSRAEEDIPNSTIQIVLPEGFVLLHGDLTWAGAFPKKGTVKLSAKIKAVRTGEWKIKGIITDFKNSFANWNFLYVEVSETTGRFSHLPFEQLQQNKSLCDFLKSAINSGKIGKKIGE